MGVPWFEKHLEGQGRAQRLVSLMMVGRDQLDPQSPHLVKWRDRFAENTWGTRGLGMVIWGSR